MTRRRTISERSCLASSRRASLLGMLRDRSTSGWPATEASPIETCVKLRLIAALSTDASPSRQPDGSSKAS